MCEVTVAGGPVRLCGMTRDHTYHEVCGMKRAPSRFSTKREF